MHRGVLPAAQLPVTLDDWKAVVRSRLRLARQFRQQLAQGSHPASASAWLHGELNRAAECTRIAIAVAYPAVTPAIDPRDRAKHVAYALQMAEARRRIAAYQAAPRPPASIGPHHGG